MKPIVLTLILLSFQILNAETIVDSGSLKVKLAAPQKVDTVPMGSYLGIYTYPPTHRFTVSANVEGLITEVAVKPYISVKKGQKLFVIQSPKLLDLQSNYIATQLEMEFYQKEMQRLAPLAAKGVVASKRYLESKNRFGMLKASADFKRGVLQVYGLSSIQLDKIAAEHKPYPTLTILSPKNATVADLPVQTGDFVNQGETLAKLVDTSECHFEVKMPWQIAATLKQEETLYANNSAYHIFAMAPQIDPISQTRSLDLHEDRACDGRGGASVNVTFYRKHAAWKIPSSSVIGMDGGYVIFVAVKNGYKVIPVTILAQLEGSSFIDASLSDNDRIAVSSVLALKSAAEGETK